MVLQGIWLPLVADADNVYFGKAGHARTRTVSVLYQDCIGFTIA